MVVINYSFIFQTSLRRGMLSIQTTCQKCGGAGQTFSVCHIFDYSSSYYHIFISNVWSLSRFL